MLEKIIKFIMSLFGCQRAPQGEEVDFSGTATWRFSGNSLLCGMDGDFKGCLTALMDAPSNGGNPTTATLSGEFTAPLGENSFIRVGTMQLQGLLKRTDGRNNIVFDVVSGANGFTGVTGNMEFDWGNDDEFIYFVGTFYFP